MIKTYKKYSTKTLPVLLRDPKILLIGGGSIAYQKAKVLTQNQINFSIVSLNISEEIKLLDVNYSLKKFEADDIKNYNIVIDATGNDNVREELLKLKAQRFFLLNRVDQPEDCDFYFSSLLLYKNIKIAVSSNGASPTLTQVIRDKIKEIIPNRAGEYSEMKLKERSENLIDVEKTKQESKKLFGKVSIIGCGPGDFELLTLKAFRLIKSADIIFYDNFIDERILSLSKESAEKFCVGKEKGHHKFNQGEINSVMLEFAKSGYQVARLKTGDPYIYGRGAEEAKFLISNDIRVDVIPGISSAIAAPLLAGIPPTFRECSSSITIVSGHLSDNDSISNWIHFLKSKDHTTIVLMGITVAEEIQQKGIEIGVSRELPVAIISNASRKNQKVTITTFDNFGEEAKTAGRPAIIVFGEVVKMHYKLFNTIDRLKSEFRAELKEMPVK